ncbi:ABC transporter permease, partial [Kitasatospora sp. NPDC057198]
MLGFVLLRLRGRLPLAAAVLFTVLTATTVLTVLVAFDRTVAEAGVRRDLDGAGRAAVLLGADHGLEARGADDAAVAALGADLFDGLPVSVRSLARSRAYGLPAAGPSGTGQSGPAHEVDLTVLAALDRDRVRLTAGQWPAAGDGTAGDGTAGDGTAGDGTVVRVAVPESTLSRLGLTGSALPARVVLSDRYNGPPLTVEVTGVYRAEDRDAPYWRLDPLGGREVQVRGFTTYGPMLVDDRAFTSGLLPQGGRSTLLSADFAGAGRSRIDRVGERADRLAELVRRDSPGLQSQTELPALLAELRAATLVTESGLLIGALQLVVLAGAALLLVVRLVAGRQAREDALLAARGATRGRLAAWTALESLLLALPAALLAPLLTGPLLRLLTGYGPLAGLPLGHAGTAVRWPAAALCALLCV